MIFKKLSCYPQSSLSVSVCLPLSYREMILFLKSYNLLRLWSTETFFMDLFVISQLEIHSVLWSPRFCFCFVLYVLAPSPLSFSRCLSSAPLEWKFPEGRNHFIFSPLRKYSRWLIFVEWASKTLVKCRSFPMTHYNVKASWPLATCRCYNFAILGELSPAMSVHCVFNSTSHRTVVETISYQVIW